MATNLILTVGGVVLPFCPEVISFCVVRFFMGLTYPTFYFNIYLLGKDMLTLSNSPNNDPADQ